MNERFVYWNQEAWRLIERNQVVCDFLPMTSHIAKLIWSKKVGKRVGSYADLVSSGYESLIRAAELYNPAHPSKASKKTYFYRSVLRAMLRAADEAGIIRIPASTLRAVRAPTAKSKVQTQEICDAVNNALSVTSLPSEWDSVVDDNEAELRLWQQDIVSMARALPTDIQDAVIRSFGLGDSQPESMSDIGASQGVTGQAIRQRRKHGLDQLSKKLMADGIDG